MLRYVDKASLCFLVAAEAEFGGQVELIWRKTFTYHSDLARQPRSVGRPAVTDCVCFGKNVGTVDARLAAWPDVSFVGSLVSIRRRREAPLQQR